MKTAKIGGILVPDTHFEAIQKGYLETETIKSGIDGWDRRRIIPRVDARYRLLLDDIETWGDIRVVTVQCRHHFKDGQLKTVLLACKGMLQYGRLEDEPPYVEFLLNRSSDSRGDWNNVIQRRLGSGGTWEYRIPEKDSDFQGQWSTLMPASCVWQDIKKAQLPNWALRHAPPKPVTEPADRAVFKAWKGHTLAEIQSHFEQSGWLCDPDEMERLFYEMTAPEAGDIIETEVDSHLLGVYELGDAEFVREDDAIKGVFESGHEFLLEIHNPCSQKIADFIM